MYIYIYTSVLLCIYMHRRSGSTCDVDAIVMLTWSKVWITKAITISITKTIANINRTVHPRPIWGHKRTKVAIPREASQNQTPFSLTGAVVDFSSSVPVSKNGLRFEYSSSEIATFGNNPVRDGPKREREPSETHPESIRKAPTTKLGAQTNKSSDSVWASPIFLNKNVINSWFLAILSTMHFCWQARQFERPKGRKLQDCKKNGVKLKKWPNPCACQQKWTCNMQMHKRTLQLENCKSGQTAVPVDKNGQGRQKTYKK